ncbi:MAG: LysM peptidoglycan-binding domain-containing protein [Sphingomonadales bacterium]
MRFSVLLLLISFTVKDAAANVWENRIRAFEQVGLPHFYNAAVQRKIDTLLINDNRKTSIMAGRQMAFQPYIDHARQIYTLPWFIRFLPAANTALETRYTDADGSTGIWPLNFSMGKKYGLKQTSILDERRSLSASSDAACHYLKDLQGIYRDWMKTIVAFRIGAVRLNQAIRQAGNSLKFDDIYEHLTPAEQQHIVNFYATLVVMYHFEETGLPKDAYPVIKSDTATTHCLLPISFFEEKTGITASELQQLNPEFKSSVIPWFTEPATFHIPASKRTAYLKVRDSLCIMHKMKGYIPVVYDTITTVKDSITYVEIKPRGERGLEPAGSSNSTSTPAPPAKVWVLYKVKPGDGFYTLSDVFDCTITEVKSWNGIRSNTLVAGSMLRFYVPYARKYQYEQINRMNAVEKRNIANKD